MISLFLLTSYNVDAQIILVNMKRCYLCYCENLLGKDSFENSCQWRRFKDSGQTVDIVPQAVGSTWTLMFLKPEVL